MMRNLLIAAGAILVLTAGSCESLGDRGGVEGSPPDYVGDVDYSAVYRNADGFPNIGQACVGGLGFATSATGRGEGGGGATPMIRVAEWDVFCKTKAKL